MVIFNHFQSIYERSPEANEYGDSHANESTNPRPGNLMVFNGILMSYLMKIHSFPVNMMIYWTNMGNMVI